MAGLPSSLAMPSASAQAARVTTAPTLLESISQDELSPTGRRLLTTCVVAVHMIGGWALWQLDSVKSIAIEAQPIMVSMIAPEETPIPTPVPPARAAQPQKSTPTPAPLIAAAPSPTTVPVAFAAPEPVPEPVQPSPATTSEPVAPSVVVTPATPTPTPPAPKQIPPGAVRYLVEPRMSVPLLSRRLKEAGTVYLHIVVDARGLLKDAEVNKSSGFARLDEQALHDIQSARFTPQTENGRPIEWQTIAPLAYEVD